MRFVTRREWGAHAPTHVQPRPLAEVVGYCLHHSGAYVTDRGEADEMAACRAIQAWSMQHLGYWDVDYECMIGLVTGNVYEGRAITVNEAAQSGHWHGNAANDSLISACVIGNLDSQAMTANAQHGLDLFVWLAGLQFNKAHLHTPTTWVAHEYLARTGGIVTACPGAHGIAEVRRRHGLA